MVSLGFVVGRRSMVSVGFLVRLRFRLSSKHRFRVHVGRGCWRFCENICCVVMRRVWQARMLARDNCRRTAFSSLSSATISNAVRTKPATARNARAGIAAFLLQLQPSDQKAKLGSHAASSYDTVRAIHSPAKER